MRLEPLHERFLSKMQFLAVVSLFASACLSWGVPPNAAIYTVSVTSQPVTLADGSPLYDATGQQVYFKGDDLTAAAPIDPTWILTSA
jgi:hypothetical protein